jgi:hypothetical protein
MRKIATILTLLLAFPFPIAFAQNAPASLDIITQQITAAYSADTSTEQRIAVWKPVIDILAEQETENKTQIAAFLERMMSERLGLRVTSSNTDIAVLVNFLKTFSKEEAVHILHVWIQANTNPRRVNGLFDSPETFMRSRTGDCTEVAWLSEVICRELDIETKVFVLRFTISHSFYVFLAGHAFTGMEFTENNITKRCAIDNRNLFELPPDDSWKNIIWRTYSQQYEVWFFVEVNTSIWHNVRRDYDDPQMRNSNMFVIFALIPMDIAVMEFAEYELSDYFDDPAQDTLFFRDDFWQTILAQKQTGEITENEYNRLLNLWQKYENDGWR